MKIVIFVLALVAAVSCTPKTFNGHQVWRITPKNQEALDVLVNLRNTDPEYIFWNENSHVDQPMNIMVAPEQHLSFFALLNSLNVEHELFMHNVQQAIDNENPKNRSTRAFNWKFYATLEEVHDWLRSIAAKYPDIVTLVEGGQSYEGRKILGVKVSYSKDNENRGVFLEGGIHAREWISSAIVTYSLNQLLTSQDPQVRQLAESHDWYVFPNVNPDGYAYTHSHDRMWRKTRTPYGFCFGADPNRNWAWKWNTAGASNNPCLDTYAGPHAFSELSTKTLSEYIATISPKLEAYLGHHAFGQLLLLPFGLKGEYPDNFDELIANGRTAMDALESVHGTKYKAGQIADLLHAAAGSSMDWVKGTFNTRIAYTYELRDTGRHGFLLPADQIIPSGKENMKALITLFKEFEKK